jgi:hypothetical protein
VISSLVRSAFTTPLIWLCGGLAAACLVLWLLYAGAADARDRARADLKTALGMIQIERERVIDLSNAALAAQRRLTAEQEHSARIATELGVKLQAAREAARTADEEAERAATQEGGGDETFDTRFIR